MSENNGIGKSGLRKVLLKCIVIFVFLVQIYRIVGVLLTVSIIYVNLVVEEKPLNLFDPSINESQYLENNVSKRDVSYMDENQETTSDWKDKALLAASIAEVFMSVTILYVVMGPLSRSIPIKKWLLWLIKMRVFWMRLLWTATAIAYCLITVQYRKELYLISDDPKYINTPIGIAVLSLTAVEYFCLGSLQCIIKIVPFEVVKRKIQKNTSYWTKNWRKLIMLSYYISTLAFALRNFTTSLYFGILSVLSSVESRDDPDGEAKYGGVILVMQIYLSIVRGKYYGFFMSDFLSTFLVEEDDPMFEEARQNDSDVEANGQQHEQRDLLQSSEGGQTQV